MLQGWGARKLDVRPIPHVEEYRARREKLSAMFPGETLVIPTGHEVTRSNDTTYRFRPGSDFFYLTGNQESDNVLVLVPKEGGGHDSVLFVEPNNRTDATFFTNSAKGELWVGPRLGVEQTQLKYGVDQTRSLTELPAFLKALQESKAPERRVSGLAADVDKFLGPKSKKDGALEQAIAELRLIKSPYEVKELSKAIGSTRRAFEDVVTSLHNGETEREVEGRFDSRARQEGNDVGYGTIAAAGEHASILHWTRNDGRLKDGKLLLLDAGVEGKNLYTADITRTLPVNGKFTEAEREIYELVRKAQQAGIAEVKPGNSFLAPHRAAMRVLAEGLEKLGILPSAEEALKPENRFYQRYSLHGTSHMLGIDVHDSARARPEVYRGTLQPGMVLTVEPGLYFQPDDLTVPKKYRNIGVRIEDDVLVTEKGHRNLSSQFPHTTEAVEKWVAKSSARHE